MKVSQTLSTVTDGAAFLLDFVFFSSAAGAGAAMVRFFSTLRSAVEIVVEWKLERPAALH